MRGCGDERNGGFLGRRGDTVVPPSVRPQLAWQTRTFLGHPLGSVRGDTGRRRWAFCLAVLSANSLEAWEKLGSQGQPKGCHITMHSTQEELILSWQMFYLLAQKIFIPGVRESGINQIQSTQGALRITELLNNLNTPLRTVRVCVPGTKVHRGLL